MLQLSSGLCNARADRVPWCVRPHIDATVKLDARATCQPDRMADAEQTHVDARPCGLAGKGIDAGVLIELHTEMQEHAVKPAGRVRDKLQPIALLQRQLAVEIIPLHRLRLRKEL